MRYLAPAVAFALAALPRIAGAGVVDAEAQKSKYDFPDPFQGASVPTIISYIISAVLSLVGALFFVMFLWGGFTWLTAGGDGKRVENARKALTNAVIGLLIVALAYVIVENLIGLAGRGMSSTTQ